jgi:thiol-disulfide isomerase/thioredoxin
MLGSTKSRTALVDGGSCDGLCQIVQDQLTKTVASEVMPTVAQSHMMLANYLDSIKDVRGAVAHRMTAAQKNPALAYSAARSIVGALKGSTHEMAGYEPVQIAGSGLIASLAELARQNVANIEARIEKAVEDEASEAMRKNLARQLSSAKGYPERITKLQAGLDLLGQPAPEWTVDHAYGEVQSLAALKGKVVILDFWATWCPWCIKSFPAIRDLLRDYKDQDLVVVGVTASAGTVYEARYDLDDDLRGKLEEGASTRAAARRARAGQEPNPERNILDADTYRGVEREAITKFIANHEMTWPVIMIDAKEPGPKYALSGWPHAVVIDRQGRVRYLKAGALLRERKEQVAAFRKVLDDLLAEGAQ